MAGLAPDLYSAGKALREIYCHQMTEGEVHGVAFAIETEKNK